MTENILSKKISYEDYVNIFLVTIIFGVIGTFLSVFLHSFALFFISIIPGVLIDMLKFAAKIYIPDDKEAIKER